MTTIENNPYYQGIGEYNGEEAHIYYDHHKGLYEVKLITGEWIGHVDIDLIQ